MLVLWRKRNRMVSAQRAMTVETDLTRTTAWEQVEKKELALDFSTRTTRLPTRRGRQENRSIKDAIIRWLEEQM